MDVVVANSVDAIDQKTSNAIIIDKKGIRKYIVNQKRVMYMKK